METKCKDSQGCKPYAKVISTKSIGQGWSKVTATEMQKDVLRNGPISIEFNYDVSSKDAAFSHYKGGIVSVKGVKKLNQITSSDSFVVSGQSDNFSVLE